VLAAQSFPGNPFDDHILSETVWMISGFNFRTLMALVYVGMNQVKEQFCLILDRNDFLFQGRLRGFIIHQAEKAKSRTCQLFLGLMFNKPSHSYLRRGPTGAAVYRIYQEIIENPLPLMSKV
jgi:hypothetical protein